MIKVVTAVGIIAIWSTIMAGGAPSINLYGLTLDSWSPVASTDLTGKSTVSAAITNGEKTGVFIVAGQSQAGNTGPTKYTPTNAKAHQLSIIDGLAYGLKDPIIGASGGQGSWVSKLADALINAGTFTRVIMVPVAQAGSDVAKWTSTGPLNQFMRVAFFRVRQQGWIGNSDVRFGIVWSQGTTDKDIGTSQAAYQASWTSMRNDVDAMGFTGKWFVAKESMSGNAVSATIQAAQAALVDNVRVFAGADSDSLTGATNRIADGTHFTDVGNTNEANLWAAVLAAQYP